MTRKLVYVLGPVAGALALLVLLIVTVLAPAGAPRQDDLFLGTGCAGSTAVAQAGMPAAGGPAVATLSAEQSGNARVIVTVAGQVGAGQQGAVVGIMTALQESELKNISYGDRDSLGLFQQRAPWGSVADRTNPAVSATLFFTLDKGPGLRGLLAVPGWQQMPAWQAAQSVQGSAFPTAYAKWESVATAAVAAILADAAVTLPATPAAAPIACPAVQQAAFAGPPGSWTQPEAPGTYVRTSPFGMRVNPVTGLYRLHGGTDLANTKQKCGAPTRAAAAGVATVKVDPSYGNLVILDNGGGIETYYAHHARVIVTTGQTVTAGQQLGFEGTTGNSNGCHLHFEVHVNGQRVDPQPFMTARGAPL